MSRAIRSLARAVRGVPVHTETSYRIVYGYDATGTRGECGGVAFPKSFEDLGRLAREAAKREIPIFMRGAGSGFSGGSVPTGCGLVVSTEKMHRVLGFDPNGRTVEVEAGVVNRELQDFLEARGFFYPPDPASLKFSTIGGNIAENAGGPRAFKYGVTRRYVASLTWLTAAGEPIESAAPEGATSLLIGGEGTLGIIYSARLRVLPMPAAFRTVLLEVRGGAGAPAFAHRILEAGLTPGVLEYIDAKTMRCVAEYTCFPGLGRDADYLFVEFDGDAAVVDAEEQALLSLAGRDGNAVHPARNAAERELLWTLRRSVSPSLARRGVTKVNEDVAVPLGAFAEAARFAHELARELELDCYLFGHAGDGNLHVNIMTDRRRVEEMKRVHQFVERLFERVVFVGGTLSGEHGIGITKSPYLRMVFTPAEIAIARGVKCAMDPALALNPGKYFMAAGVDEETVSGAAAR